MDRYEKSRFTNCPATFLVPSNLSYLEMDEKFAPFERSWSLIVLFSYCPIWMVMDSWLVLYLRLRLKFNYNCFKRLSFLCNCKRIATNCDMVIES
jgi:hypothetical protein